MVNIKHIETIVKDFNTISLEEMDNYALLNRMDLKYTINIKDLPDILNHIKSDYLSLSIEDKQVMQYKSLYFDTEDFNLYRLHHNGKLNRYKVRIREYQDTNTVFFETKFKNNKGRTLKNRFRKENQFELDQVESDFVREMTNIDPNILEPGILVYYKRATFVNPNTNERVTADLDLTFEFENNSKKFENIVIIEIKTSKGKKSSPLLDIIKEKKIEPFGMSKYCLGVSSLVNDVKTNNFKEKILTLNKLNSIK